MEIQKKIIQAISSDQKNGWGGIIQAMMTPVSFLYQGATTFRSALYEHGILTSRRLTRPVISVGNLMAGGTGKTPLVIKIVQELAKEGIRSAVLSRGYKGSAHGLVNIVSDLEGVRLSAKESGDEPYLMAHKLAGTPVLVGGSRFALGKEAIRVFDVDCLVLDDGFQHLALRRDCDILLLDGERPFGNGRCLPAGLLRESAAALKRADLILLTGEPEEETLSQVKEAAVEKKIHQVQFVPDRVQRHGSHEDEGLDMLDGKSVLAFAGIGRPERFYNSLRSIGADIVAERSFPDHHPYTRDDMTALFKEAKNKGVDCLITTEKDAVRIFDIPESPHLLTLGLSVRLHDRKGFVGDIRDMIGKS